METAAPRSNFHQRAERRIGWLTLALGCAAAAAVALLLSLRAGVGVFVGAALAWVNLRWLQQALDSLVLLSTAQVGAPKPRISFLLYVKFFGRYALIVLVLYAMVARFGVPILSLLGGLCALGAAAMVESVYELIAPQD